MKLRYKSAILVFCFGVTFLLITSFCSYFLSRNLAIDNAHDSCKRIAEKTARYFETLLKEKVKIASTLANAPIVGQALATSNRAFAALSAEQKQTRIDQLNRQWIETKEATAPFIQGYTTNPVAVYLKAQQAEIPEEYGEIFITNRYGVIIATTGKLTTLAHAHKYWWKASYHSGKGRIFFDDRGFDESVKGYVLGVVIPIKNEDHILGILKCNLNIIGALNQTVTDLQDHETEVLKLIRSKGLVVFEEGTEPLSNKVSKEMVEAMKRWDTGSGIMRSNGVENLIAYTPIQITKGSEIYGFGGKYKSIDHIKGNVGEGWFVMSTRDLKEVLGSLTLITKQSMVIGLFLTFLMAVAALFIGKRLSMPVISLSHHVRQIGKGDFELKLAVQSRDELGDLANSINKMVENLKRVTASREKLAKEISERKQAEDALRKSEERYRSLIENIPIGVYRNTPGTKGKFLMANPAYLMMFGFDSEEELKKFSVADLAMNTSKRAEFSENLLAQGSITGFEFLCKRKDGTPLLGSFTNKVVYDEKGEAVYFDGIVEDITERKKTEEALQKTHDELEQRVKERTAELAASLDKLQEAELRYRTVADFTYDWEYWENPDGTLQYVSPSCERITGYRAEEFLDNPSLSQEIILPEDMNIWHNHRHESLEELKTREIQFRILTRNGNTCWIEHVCRPVTDDGGAFMGFRASNRDITDRKQAEEALKKSEEKYRHLFENSAVGIDITTKSGKILESNHTMQKMMGYSMDELSHVNLYKTYVNPEDRKDLLKIVDIDGKVENFEVQLLTKKGEAYWANLSIKIIQLNGESVLLTSAVNVQDQKKAEDALRKSEERANKYLEIAGVAFVALNNEGNITLINERGLEILDYRREELLGKNWVKTCLPERMQDDVSDVLNQLLRGEVEPVEYNENPVLRKDGKERIIAWHNAVLRNPAGEIEGVLSSGEDITQQKRAEQERLRLYNELKVLNLELEDKVKKRTRDLEMAVRIAEEANRAKSDFLANMSHELRTPLNAVIGFSQMLLDQYFGELNEKQAEYVKDILESGKHLLSLINDILDLAKVEAGKMELELSQVDIKALLDSSLVMIKEKAHKHGIALVLDIPEEILALKIQVDERKIKQVMFNLLSNAAKFTPDGGEIRVTADIIKEFRNSGIQELIERFDNSSIPHSLNSLIQISVADTGIGIAPEDQQKIFEEFHQAKSGYSDKTPGTGLGLPLAKQFVKLHGGDMWVESEGEGKGSRFSFILPTKPLQSEEAYQEAIKDLFVKIMASDRPLSNNLAEIISLSTKHNRSFILSCFHTDIVPLKEKALDFKKVIEKEKRNQDFFGTDKDGYFYFIFQDTDAQKGKAACERLKKKAEGVFKDVKISFSMAVFPEDGESPDALLKKVRNI